MRLRFALVCIALLVGVDFVLAQGEGDAAGPTPRGYYCGGSCCCMAISLAIVWYFFGAFFQEYLRGQKREPTFEEAVRDAPRKQQAMFKGEKVPDWKIASRQKATRAILKFLSYTDTWFEKKYVADVADEAFRLVKDAIEAGSIKGIERRVTPECLEEIRTEVKNLRKERERHVFGRVEVTGVMVLHVEAPAGKENHTFTALISAKSKDFFEDDETGEVLRGDKKTYTYQEFWTFRRSKERWLLELRQPSTDLDNVLEAKNVLAAIDLEEFAKDADPEFLKEVVAR